MEDNDLRGFLDGRFVAAWNQPSQVHVRLGRAWPNWSRFDERELFRVLQRWDGIRLPEAAKIRNVRLDLAIENGSTRDLEVFVYEVKKDWNPGEGGTDRNNTSPPAPGEVWWNEAGRGVRAWGLPGAGFVSDTHPEADTSVMPLALAHYRPGDRRLSFESSRLNAYTAQRIAEGKPLLFLIKQADFDEDIPGSCIDVFSANHGDDWNPDRRPQLTIEWESDAEASGIQNEVILEYGRSLLLPWLELEPHQSLAATFVPLEGSLTPSIKMRLSQADEPSAWFRCNLLNVDHRAEVQVRVDAFDREVALGTAFNPVVRDTWVPAATPESRRVVYRLTAPSGETMSFEATYSGGSRWTAEFVPTEIGRWRYRWTSDFTGPVQESAEGFFDVLALSSASAAAAIDELSEAVRRSSSDLEERQEAFAVQFYRLERALMRFESPATYPLRQTAPDGGTTGEIIDRAREELSLNRPVRPRLAIDSPTGVTPRAEPKEP